MKTIYKVLLLLLLIGIIIGFSYFISIKNTTYLEGTIIEIYEKGLLVESDNKPYVISFKKEIDSKIKVGDYIKAKIDDAIAESYPMQAKGYSIIIIDGNNK